LQITTTYDVTARSRFRQEGILRWTCDSCPKRGRGRVTFITSGDEPSKAELVLLAASMETEHSMSCKGSVSLVSFEQKKCVDLAKAKRSRRISLMVPRLLFCVGAGSVAMLSAREILSFLYHLLHR
jgi:hypothetical protein